VRSQSRIWDHFQSEGIESFSNSAPRMRFLAGRLHPGLRVLNVGIGGGIFEAIALTRNIEVYSLDPSDVAVQGLRLRLKMGDRVLTGCASAMPFRNSFFDAIVMSEVLEHLDDTVLSTALGEVRRLLNAQGRFLITVPNDERLLDDEVLCPCCGERFHRWGHVRSFTRGSLTAMLEGHGFAVTRLTLEAFPDWRRKGFANKLKSAARYFSAKLGIRLAQPRIFAEARLKNHEDSSTD
jgi:SAM-dependent methyltransferase